MRQNRNLKIIVSVANALGSSRPNHYYRPRQAKDTPRIQQHSLFHDKVPTLSVPFTSQNQPLTSSLSIRALHLADLITELNGRFPLFPLLTNPPLLHISLYIPCTITHPSPRFLRLHVHPQQHALLPRFSHRLYKHLHRPRLYSLWPLL